MRPGRVVLAFLHCCILAFPTSAPAQPDQAKTEALAARAAARLQTLQREAERLASEEQTLLNELRRLEVDREIKAEEVRRADAQGHTVSAQIAAATEEMRALQQRDDAERPVLRARLVEIYKMGDAQYLKLLLSASDLRSVGQATRTVMALAALDRARLLAHQQTLNALRATRRELEAKRTELESLRGASARAQAEAVRAAQAHDARIKEIDQRRDLNAQLTGELATAQQKLQTMLREARTAEAGAEAALPLRPFKGELEWPVDGTVRRRFGRASASGGTANGIEIAADTGTPVRAIHDGIVAFADTFSGFGKIVILDHGARTFSLYGNLLDIGVSKGAHVDRGAPVGTSGASATGGPGLYFELRIDGQPVDPLQWLKAKKQP